MTKGSAWLVPEDEQSALSPSQSESLLLTFGGRPVEFAEDTPAPITRTYSCASPPCALPASAVLQPRSGNCRHLCIFLRVHASSQGLWALGIGAQTFANCKFFGHVCFYAEQQFLRVPTLFMPHIPAFRSVRQLDGSAVHKEHSEGLHAEQVVDASPSSKGIPSTRN